MSLDASKPPEPTDFIRQRVRHDLDEQVVAGVVTRFPPEPNGYLHIGHAKSICLNFGVAREFGGVCYLRFDDTNPVERRAGVRRIDQSRRAVARLRLGRPTELRVRLFRAALRFRRAADSGGQSIRLLLSAGRAEHEPRYADRAGPGEPRSQSQPIDENLDLFAAMRARRVSRRQRIRCARRSTWRSPNVNMRDPVLYRIRHAHHQRTGDKWCIYPTYDYTHCLCDAFEGITHSLCTLEFEDHRPLYDWVLDNVNVNWHPPQIEFSPPRARVHRDEQAAAASPGGRESGRRLGRSAHADHCRAAPPRRPSRSDPRLLRSNRRHEAGQHDRIEPARVLHPPGSGKVAPRGMAVLAPLKIDITNYPRGTTEAAVRRRGIPNEPDMGVRSMPFGRRDLHRADDFARSSRRRTSSGSCPAAWCDCGMLTSSGATRSSKDASRPGDGVALHATLPESKSGQDTSGLKPKGVIHWVAARIGRPAELRLYEHLFKVPNPAKLDFAERGESGSR